jgi:hypothetical protein
MAETLTLIALAIALVREAILLFALLIELCKKNRCS